MPLSVETLDGGSRSEVLTSNCKMGIDSRSPLFGSPPRYPGYCPQSVFLYALPDRLPISQYHKTNTLGRARFSPLNSNAVYVRDGQRFYPGDNATSKSVHGREGGRTSSPTSSDKSASQSSFTSSIFSRSSGRSTPNSQDSFRPVSPSAYRGSGRPRMQVSSLLTESRTRSYHLEVIQHPQKTAEFGTASSLSRLPLTPPIVAQLTIRDRTGNCVIPDTELPFLVAHLSLFTADGLTSLDMGSAPGAQAEDPPRRLLYGNLVTSPQKLRDPEGKYCIFFIFADVSIRWRGRFQIGISLVGISSTDSTGTTSIADHGTLLAQARTRPFEVLPHHDYVAAPLTALTQCLIRQGVRMFPSMPSQPRPRP